MKRTLGVTLVVGGLLLATLTLLPGRQPQMLVLAEDDPFVSPVDVLPSGSIPGMPGNSGAASSDVQLPQPLNADEKLDAASPLLPTLEPPPSDEPKRTRVIRIPGREPRDVARLLTELFGEMVNVTVDHRSEAVVITVARAKLWSEVQFYLDEIDATVKRLSADLPPTAARRLPPTDAFNPLMTSSSDQADAAMNHEARQLALRVRAAKEPEKSKLRAELELLADRHFEHRQQRRKRELDELADRVDKLRVSLHGRQEKKTDILKRRLADLLDEEHELKWDDTRTKPLPTLPVAAPKSAPLVQPPNLDGEWLVTLPTGIELVGTIEKRPEGCWSFQEMQSLSGYYQLEGNMLKAVITDKKQPQEYEWQILNDNVMVLTKSPPQEKIGSDFRGATLRRGGKPKSSPVRSQSDEGVPAKFSP